MMKNNILLEYVKDLAERIESEYTPNSEITEKYMPYPLDADGVPCRLGDVMTEKGSPFVPVTITKMFLQNNGWRLWLAGKDSSVRPDSMHHVKQSKPLAKEDIDAKSKTSCQKYWNCEGYGCNECPAKIQGKNPNVYYEVPYCSQAQTIDILRLERERVAGER